MSYLNDWHDWVRLIILSLSLLSFVSLLRIRFQIKENHTVAVRDEGIILTAWSVTAAALSVEGILVDSPAGYRLAFLLLSIALTLRETHRMRQRLGKR